MVERLLTSDELSRALRRLSAEIAERAPKAAGLVGIRRGGVPAAIRIAASLGEIEGRKVPVGAIDIALYRDDAAIAPPDPKIGPSRVEFDVEGKDVVLVDDVLMTGRTVRAAIDSLMDYGRPHRIWLAVIVDRGGRELPIAPDFVGRAIDVPKGGKVIVELEGEREGAWIER